MRKYILDFNATIGKFEKKELDEPDVIGPVDYAVREHLKARTFEHDALSEKNIFVLGNGALAGSHLPGTHRLVFMTRSPTTNTLMFSSIGGAGIPLYECGVDFVKLSGKAPKLSILFIKNVDDYLSAELIPIERQEVFQQYEKNDNEGVYGFANFLIERFKKEYEKPAQDDKKGYFDFRIVAPGPCAFNTRMGAMNSLLIRNGAFQIGAEGWAGRAGFGSALVQGHNICALVFGGNANFRKFPKMDLKDVKVLNEFFNKEVGKTVSQAAMQATEKYRYVEKLKTGGTLGVNLTASKEWVPMFNWKSVNYPKEQRKDLYDKFILNGYLKEFNEQTIEPKQFRNCGEACVAMCKKVRGNFKKDYETYEAFGPNMGVFTQKDAERVSSGIENMGFDSIGGGNMISALLEAVHVGLLTKEDLGLPASPNFNPDTFTIEQSKLHAELAYKIALDFGYGKTEIAKLFDDGIRDGFQQLSAKFKDREEKTGKRFMDLISYNAFGKIGYSVPCQYWVPGFWAPIHITGKFFTYYQKDFREPADLGEQCAERSILEMYSENTGICRFHRGWSEKLVPKLINEAYGINIDYYKHCRDLLKKIMEYNDKAGNLPVVWETFKTVEIIRGYLKAISLVGEPSKANLEWIEKFDSDAWKAAEEYWSEMKVGIAKHLL
ncbi:MAG: hypothetical protein KKG59_01220 [Nanoarchaeota archaeon]|nr:hypothetical protein [Nanoarchaeota archaeon]